MRIKRLYLRDFLSYPEADATFGDGLNAIVGENAAGKTNLVDAVYLGALGKCSRGMRDKELIRWNAPGGARVKLLIEKEFSRHTVEFYIDPLGKKRILVDDLPIGKLAELFGTLCMVFFSPDELKLVKESPDYRRRFMDVSLSQLNKRYFYELQRYHKLLQERNTLLKTDSRERNTLLKADSRERKSLVGLVTREMIPSAKFITDERIAFLRELSAAAEQKHRALTGGKEALTLSYQMEAADEAELLKRFETAYPRDLELRYTTVGPHRDDVKIAADGVDLRRFGSQGQQRTAVLSMKLAEAELFRKRTGETPVMVLDDVLSELDANRTRALLDALEGVQTLVTCTKFEPETQKDYRILEIKDHKIRSIEG